MQSVMDLGAELLARAEKAVADALRGAQGLDTTLRAHLDAARRAWPEVQVDDARFVAHVARSLPDEDTADALAKLHATDIYLALACGMGDVRAIAEFEKRFIVDVPDALAHLAAKAQPDEVVQVLRAKLLVAEEGREPKILDYSGRGPLAGWLRIAAIRTALDLARRRANERTSSSADALLDVPAAVEDPELEHIRARHRADFKRAFEEALRSISKEDRNILRLHLVDGLNIDEIGTIFQVHRATAARWIARCRERVHDETRRILTERLRIGDSELRSILGIVRSQLDLSINRLLSTDEIDK
jgi:RNA polymerase sigma-70 factor (ECF subfamily)